MHSKTAYEKTTRSQLGESAVFPCIRNIVLDIPNQQLLVRGLDTNLALKSHPCSLLSYR